MPRAPWPLFVLLLGCTGKPDSGGDTSSCIDAIWYRDVDGDGWGLEADAVAACEAPSGYGAGAGDCDDADALVNPAAAEACNGHDDDCDGLVDDVDDEVTGTVTTFWDGDEDGYGDPLVSVASCLVPPGFIEDDQDCDDTRADVHPGADEVCDGADNDCDERADDADDDVVDPLRWYEDTDGDGHGDPAAPVDACVATEGLVEGADDCDDTRGDVFPGAPERCDGVDNDCDLAIDSADSEVDPTSGAPWYADVDGDGFGDAAAATVRCEGADGLVEDASDCDDGDGAVHPGAADDCDDAVDNDCDGYDGNCADPADATASIVGEAAGDLAGRRLARVGDTDGDGTADVWMGSAYVGRDGAAIGAAYLRAGPYSGEINLPPAADARVYGNTAYVDVGRAVGGGADLDGDGVPELLLAGTDTSAGGAGLGFAAVFLGGTAGRQGVDDAAARITALTDGSTLGEALLLTADATGDGVAELWVADPGEGAGALYGYSGLPAGLVDPSAATVVLRGEGEADRFGAALTDAGDVDGDGLVDLWVARTEGGCGGAGGVALLLAPFTGDSTAAPAATWCGPGGQAGAALAGGVDHDGDGAADLLVGDPSGAGAAWLRTDAAAGGALADGAAASFAGGADGDALGAALALLPDQDGDGLGEVWIGAPGEAEGGVEAGQVGWFAGPLAGALGLDAATLRWRGGEGERLGATLVGPGDLDGDGVEDVLLGAPGVEGGTTEAGTVWIVTGGPR